MCLVTFSPIEKVRFLEKGESEENRFIIYFGEVYIKTQEVSFLKAVLVSLAPSFLSYWFFMYLLDILIYTQVHVVILFFLIFIMISLIFSANPSHTDLELISEAFDNDTINSLYQLLLIFLSGLITWHLNRIFNLQLPHEIFMYLIIAGFYFLLKYCFKITGYILSSMNTERSKASPSPKRRSKKLISPKYKPFAKSRKKKSIIKKSYRKKLWKLNEKESSKTENVVRQTEKHIEQRNKKSEFKNKNLNKILTNEIVGKKYNIPIKKEIGCNINSKASNDYIVSFFEKEKHKRISNNVKKDALKNNHIKLNKKETHSFMKKRESFNFSKSEIDFFKNHDIEVINLIFRWEWLDKNPSLIKDFFYEVIYPIFNRIPDAQEIRKIGYRTFLRKFRALGGIWGEVKKNGRFYIPKKKPLKKKQSWRDITQRELDFLNKYKIKKENLKSRWEWAYNNKPLIILFFQEVIYPILGYIPKDDDIKKLGYRGLIQPIQDIGKTVTKIINEAYRNKEYISQNKHTWKDFTQDEINFFEKYDIQWKNLKSRWNWATNSPHLIKPFFIEVIIPIKNRIPTTDELRTMGFRGLFEVIDDKFDYLNVINEISNEMYDKEYNFTRNIPIKKIDEIREIVKRLANKFLLTRKEPRSINYISGKIGIGWSTFSNHAIKYLQEKFGHKNGVELYNLMWESEEMKIQKIGVRSHILINDLLTIHFKSISNIFLDHSIKYYSEPNIFQGGLHPDGLILLTPVVIKFFERLNNNYININLSKFKAIIFDVTIDSSEKNIKKKILKYSRDDLVLFIISLRDEYSCYFKPLPITLQKKYKGLVKIIDFQTFKILFGISGILEANFDKIVKLISLEDLEKLYKISLIPKDQKYFTHNLKDDVKMIIKKKFKEYFNYSIK